MSNPVPFHDELVVGRRKFDTLFRSSPPRTLKAGESLTAAGPSQGIYRLRDGWACQYRDLGDTRRAIVDVYLPGDVMGLDHPGVHTRPPEEIQTLTASTLEVISAQDALINLMADRPTALYIAFLLGQRQRRTDRLLAAISSLDARGRLAMMLLDFYTRLRRRKLISGSIYNLPLTQLQIGNYLGLTVVHINRVLGSLCAQRVVGLEKHCVTILDLDQLAILARNRGTASSPASDVRNQVLRPLGDRAKLGSHDDHMDVPTLALAAEQPRRSIENAGFCAISLRSFGRSGATL